MSPAVLSVSFNVDCASQRQEKPPPKAHRLIETIQSPLRPLKCCRRALCLPGPGPQGLRAGHGQYLGGVRSTVVPQGAEGGAIPPALSPQVGAVPSGPAPRGLGPGSAGTSSRSVFSRENAQWRHAPRRPPRARALSRYRRILPLAPPPPSGEFCTAAKHDK